MSTRHCQAVSPASGSPAASTSESPAGRCGEVPGGGGDELGVGARRAREPRHAEHRVADREPGDAHADRVDLPATSQPTVNGGGPITLAMPLPARVFQSTGLTPDAATRTRTSVGSGRARAPPDLQHLGAARRALGDDAHALHAPDARASRARQRPGRPFPLNTYFWATATGSYATGAASAATTVTGRDCTMQIGSPARRCRAITHSTSTG